MRKFELENKYVLALVQAMIGAISPNFRAVWMTLRDDTMIIDFVLEHDDPVDQEEIEFILFEFEALQDKTVLVEHRITITSKEFMIPEDARRVFKRREDAQPETAGDR